MASFYLAGPYARRHELKDYARQLEALGHKVTSSWLDTEEAGHDFDQHAKAWSERDFADIRAADTLLSFTEPPGSPHTRGGRHVEFGYAAALDREQVIIGPRETTFHYLVPSFAVFPTFAAFYAKLCEQRPVAA